VIAYGLPYLPFGRVFGFAPLPGALLLAITLITMLYVVAAELQKKWFYRRRIRP
jgi:Mg2+-importing ATPase